ncbi:MAG TPA: hypothetical protein VN903_31615 [Polyangia bacterium]|jgi:hypothetical protein|nr:hypothetical protein [Polyangia bacterium]
MPAMYFSAHQYPSLKHRPKAERYAIIRAALKDIRKGYTKRFFVALVATVVVLVRLTRHVALDALPTDWRLWTALAVGFVLLYGWALFEINGPVRRAVEKHLAAQNG